MRKSFLQPLKEVASVAASCLQCTAACTALPAHAKLMLLSKLQVSREKSEGQSLCGPCISALSAEHSALQV